MADPLDPEKKPRFAADLGGLDYDQNRAVAMSGLDPKATALDERRRREDERFAKSSASHELERRMRATGQKFHTDELGRVMPDADETGNPVFQERDKVDYTPEGLPVRTQVDKTGVVKMSDPDAGAPIGGADNDPGMLYKQNKYQPWSPVGSAYDLKDSQNIDPAIRDAAVKVAKHGEDAIRKSANEGISDIEAKASLAAASSKAESEDLSKAITEQNTQLDQQNERAGKTEGGSWFFNMGAKPTADAVVAKSQADKAQAQIAELEKRREEAARRQITADAESKRVKTEGDILKATNQLQGYEAAEQKRREMLIKAGKTPEEIDADPMVSAIAKKRQEVGLDKSNHEQQRIVMQGASEAAARSFAADAPTREDFVALDKSFMEKKGAFDEIQRQYTAESERLKKGIFTNSEEASASRSRLEDLAKQMQVAGASANAMLQVRNAAVQAINSPTQSTTPRQGARSIDVSVGPDMQLSFKDSRDLTQTAATTPQTGGSQPASPAGATPQGQAGSLSQKKGDLKSGIMPYQRQIIDERNEIMRKKMEVPEDWGSKTAEEKKTLVEEFQNQKDSALAEYDAKKSEAGGEQAQFIKGLGGGKPQSYGEALKEALKDEFTGRIRAVAVAPYAGVQDIGLGFVETLATIQEAITGQKFEDTTLAQFAKGAREQTAEAMGDKADTVTAQLARGAGSSFGFMAGGPTKIGIAAIGALSGFGSGYREALEMGATGAKAYGRAAVKAGLDATEAIPIGNMFARLEKVVPGSVKKFLVNTGAQFVEEGGQEFFQDAAQSTYDKLTGLTKDDWGKIFGDAASNAAIAGFTGLLMAGGMNAANIRSQRKAATKYSTQVDKAITSYDQSGGTNARVAELGNQWRSLPTIEASQGVPQPEQYAADQKAAEAVTSQLPEGSPAVRPEQIAFARQIAPVFSGKAIADMQVQLSALDAKVAEARQKAREAGMDGGFFKGTDYEAQGIALKELGSAINERADFLNKMQGMTEEASQRSILSVQAAQEILAMPNAENRSMATGLVKIASGLDQNLLTGTEREMLLRPRKVTTPDPATGAPVTQTLPPLVRMEQGQMVITDEAISWMGNNAPISENLIPLDETARLKQIYSEQESHNAQSTGTTDGSPATAGATGEGEQPIGNAPGSDQGTAGGIGQGSEIPMGTDGGNQGVGTGAASPFAPSGDSQSEQRRKLNATRLNPAVPAAIAKEARGIASSFQQAGKEVGLDVEEVPKDKAGNSGALVTFTDDGRIIFMHNPIVMAQNASASNGRGKTTEGNASEYLYSMFGEEGLHFGWFSHLRDQWNAKPEEEKGTFSSFVHEETRSRFEDMRGNLANIGKTPIGIELSKAVIGAYNNYYGEESKQPIGDGENEASGNAIAILDRLSNQTDPNSPENAFNFMNEFARQLAQMRVEGRVTESADANGFFEAMMKYLRSALDALRKVAGDTKNYDAGLDEMVSSMESRYADIQALMGIKPDAKASETQESTENRQKQPESTAKQPETASAESVTETVRLRQENNRLKAEQEERKASQERAKARQGDAKERAAQIDASTMASVNPGRPAIVTAANNEQIPARYVTLPAGVVQTSHSPVASSDGSPAALFPKNPNYGGENTRPYDTDATEQGKVNSIAMPGALIPDEIINNSPSAAGGPPQIARVTFTDREGNVKTVFQTAGGNGREMGINLSSQEDQARLSDSLRQSAGVFGLQDVPEGHRVYRFLGAYDLRNPEEARAYQQLVDKLNPSQGKIQGTTQRAKIDANIKIPTSVLSTLTMDTDPSDAQQIVRRLINDKSLGLDRNLMEATASDPVQSQQYVQQLVIASGLKSDKLNEAYFDLRGDTASNPARSTMRALIGGTAELAVKLRQKNSPELADSLAAALERVNSELEKPKNPPTLKQALLKIAAQQENDALTQGAGGNQASGADVQAIAKALLDNVKTGAGGKLSASTTQENFAALLRDINLAVDQQTDEVDIFGETRSVSDLIKAAIENNNRRRGIVGEIQGGGAVDGNAVAAKATFKDDEELKSAITEIHTQATAQAPKFLHDIDIAARGAGVKFQSQYSKHAVKKLDTALSKVGRKAAVPSDILRATVVSDKRNPEGVVKDALRFVESMFNVGYKLYAPNGAIDFTNRFDMADWDYKDVAMKFVREGDPVVKEVLMLQPNMLEAKQVAHGIYDIIREIERRLNDQKNPMKAYQVADIQKVRRRLEGRMKQLYKVAFKKDNQRAESKYSLTSSTSSEARYLSDGDGNSPAITRNALSENPSSIEEGETPISLAAFSTKDFRSATDRGLSLIRSKINPAGAQSQDAAAARRSRFQDDSTADLFSVGGTETTPQGLTAQAEGASVNTETQNNEQPNDRRLETDARRPEPAGAEEPTQIGGMGELFSFMAGQQSAERDFESAKSEAELPPDAGRQNDPVPSIEGSDGRGGGDAAVVPVSEGMGGTGRGADAGRPARKGRTISQAGTGVAIERPEEGSPERNISLNRDQRLAPKGVTGKLKANLAAIRIIKALESEGRLATPEEKQELVKFSGWGALSQSFDDDKAEQVARGEIENLRAEATRYEGYGENAYYAATAERNRNKAQSLENWKNQWGEAHDEIKSLLSDAEYNAAKRSTINAHYTSAEIVAGMWDAVKALGFEGGNVLEPGAGIGHFFGLMPSEIADKSRLFGVELDRYTSKILKALYPEADIQNTGFQTADIADNSIDLAISNVPFANVPVNDPALEAMGGPTKNLHDYFFGKTLTKLKPGGVMAFITSAFTMDKGNPEIRKWLAERADLVAAYRLPNNAFKDNAGTDVVTDVIILRKKDGKPFPHGQSWVNLGDSKTQKGEPIRINEYFANNPSNIFGLLDDDGSMYGDEKEMTVHGDLNNPPSVAMMRQLASLPKAIMGKVEETGPVRTGATGTLKFGNVIKKDGKYFFQGQETPDEALNAPENAQRVDGFITLRDALNKQYDLELSDTATESQIEENRTALNAAYDRFIKIRVTKKTRTGKITNSALGTSTYIHDSFNKSLFAGDPDIFRLLGAELEVERKATSLQNIADIAKGKTKKAYKKADVFSKRVLEPRSEPTKADTIEDAYGISLGWRNRIDTQFIAGLIDKTQEQVEKGLLERGIAFQDPSTGQLFSREQYISGNVRKKLQIAKASGPAYQRNVDLLESVQPQRVGISDIKFKVGATWIPSEVYTEFLESLGVQGFKFIYKTAAGSSDWAMVKDKRTWKSGVAYKDFETNDVGIEHVMDSLLNFNPIVINFPKKEGGKRNEPATQAAREKAKLLTERFVKWANENEKIANQLTDIYNEEVNAHVQRTYDGQFLSLPWANKDFGIYPDKKNTIWRAIQEGYGLIAHGVGGGKTVIGTSIALEMRRLGMAKKPMIVVHNATLEGFAKEIAKMAPSSRILIGRKDELAGAKKKEFLMRIAAGDWDAVVIAHSTFSGISDDPDVEIAQSKSLIDEALATLKEAGYDSVFDAKADRKKPPTVKALVKLIEKLETAIDKAKDRKNTEKDLLNFQQLGVDSLIVDEVHEFKKIPFTTHLTAKGIDGSMSKRAYALFMRARQIQAKTGGKNIFSMTGTPVTNTLGEIWNMIRLVAPNVLKEYKVELFDQFHSKFAEVVTQSEMGPSGEYKNVERLAKFVNLPEWNTFLRQAADIKLGDDMVVKNRPDIKGGAPELIVVKRTKGATEWVRYIREVLKAYEEIPGKEKQKNPKLMAVPVQSYMASRAAAIDIRLIDPTAKDEPGSKVNVMIENLMGIYERTTEYSGTQVIFADSYRSVKTSIFDEVMASTLNIEKDPNKVAKINTDEAVNESEEAEEDEEEDEDPSKAYTDDRFNIYEDIREKLIARGVPAEQIAVITDKKYKTDKDKQALFDKVNSGEVRIIMGSTQKLGTGVNMQRLMITGHDLDVPWTPAGLEQRAGRVYRQGNIHGELGVPIELYRYGMEDTLDSSLWQKLVTKQRTSYAALSGKVTGRELEEDDVSLNLSEQQAVLGGKTSLRIWEIENRLKELGISRQANIDESARRATEIRNAKTYLRVDGERADRVAPSIAAMEAVAASVTEKGVNIEVGGETFKTKTETAEAIKAALEESRNGLALSGSGSNQAPDVTSISVNGLPLRLSSITAIDKVYDEEAQSMVEKITTNYELVARPEDRDDDMAFGRVTSPATLLSRLEELGETIEGIKSSQRRNLENLRQVAEMPEAADWPYAGEYEALVKELEEMRKAYRQELGLKEEEAKTAEAQPETAPPETPMSEGEQLKNNFVAAARRINSFADEQRTADNPDYQAALEAAKEAREALADYNIGRREGDADYISAVAARAPRMQEGKISVAEGEIQAYLDFANVPKEKRETAKKAFKKAASASTTPYQRGDISPSGGVDRDELRQARAEQAAAYRGLLKGDTEAVRNAIQNGIPLSKLISAYAESKSIPFSIQGAIINSPADLAAHALAHRTPYFESLKVVVMDKSNQVVHSEIVSIGSLNESIAHPREILRAVERGKKAAAQVGREIKGWILSHNHPSGDPKPSEADRRLTRRIDSAATLMGVPLIDHIITNGESYFSFSEAGLEGGGIKPAGKLKPKLQVIPKISEIATGVMADWEAVPASETPIIDRAERVRQIRATLQTADPGMIHVLNLNTRLGIISVDRHPLDATPSDIYKKSLLHGTYGIALSLPETTPDGSRLAADERTGEVWRKFMGKMQEAGMLYQVPVMDAVLGDFSYREAGLLLQETAQYGEGRQVVPSNVIGVTDYSEGRELAHGVKNMKRDAINKMASEMAKVIPKDAVIVPMSGRSGRAGNMLEVAKQISKLTGNKVEDVIRGKERESLYEMKKRGEDASSVDLGLSLSNNINSDNVYVIDNVLATGTTARAISDILPNAKILVHSIDRVSLLEEPAQYGQGPAVAARASRMQGDGFYSQLQRTIEAKMPNRASVDQIRAIIDPAKGSGVKPDEIKWSNLEGFLDGKKSVTKEEVLEYLQNEGAVKFEERTLGVATPQKWSERHNQLQDRYEAGEELTQEEERELFSPQPYNGDFTPTKYSQYVLPGGENYREVVLTMPVDKDVPTETETRKQLWVDGELVAQGDERSAQRWISENPNADIRDFVRETKASIRNKGYVSSHFSDIPNYVAHMRLDERKDASGKDGLFIEEIQSDRHQAGREKGYRGDKDAEMESLLKKRDSLPNGSEKDAIQLRINELGRGDVGVPDAPFRKDWSVQMFKRALRDAIASGKEWIGWTSGETQAKRYDLSKQVDEVSYGGGFLRVKTKAERGGTRDYINEEIPPERIEDYIGKEAARRLLDSPKEEIGKQGNELIYRQTIRGNALKVGGEGMKGFYDQILPKEIGKYVKKWGGKVEEGDIKTNPKEYDTTPIWKVAITPEMRESVQTEGQAVFARSPYFGGLDSRAAQQVEDAFNDLDADSMLEQQAKAETQAPGQRTIGTPRRALGALNTQIMGVDEYRERIATTETQKQWQAEASTMLKSDYEGTRKRLIQAGMLGGSLTPAETKAAMMIVARESAAAATDPSKRAEVAKLIYAYRETGREEARSLSARRDMFMTPKERHREFLAKMIFSPGRADQAAIERIESPTEREAAITAAVDRRMSEIEKALQAMGVTFDDILKGEVQISLIGSRVVENTLRGFSDKEQQALRMMQAGQKYENIAKTLGFSVSQVKAMRLKAVASIKKRHFDKVRKGLTVDDLKQDMNAVYARSPRQISEEAAEAEFAKIIDALGFGENAGTGKRSGKKPFTLEDPIEVIKIARLVAATDKGALDMVHEYWMASLLSGITTHVANITGNTANAALDLTFQRGMETLVNSMVGDKDSARAGEFKYLMSGLKGSMSAAFRAGIRAYDAEQSMVDYDLLGHELSINPSGFIPGASAGAAIKGKAGRAIRTPLRALAFMDDFSKTMVARMEVGAQAYRIGKANGYNGDELSKFIASEVETIGSQSWERAVGRATILAFQEKLRSLDEGGNLIEGGAVALNKGLSNYKPGKFFVPFINTIYNIFRTGVRKTPVGSASMLYKAARHGFYQIRNGKLNPNPYVASEFVRDGAEQVMAWALLSMMWGVVPGDDDDDKKDILITGSQPFQRGMTGLQDLSQRSGVPPYHIRIGDTLFNYGRIEPIATVLGTTADLVKAGKMARDSQSGSDILGYISSRILGQITDKTYGRGMSDIAGFIQDPKSMANWAATFASTFVPNILRQPMRAFDPYVRETSIETSPKNLPAGIAQRFMQSAVPMAGVNQPRIDLYGNPVKKEGSAVSRLLLPAQASPAPKVQPADRLFSNWNKNNPSEAYAPSRASRRYYDPVTGEVKYMDDKTFQRFSEKAGKTFAATSRAVITPSMAKNPTEDDKDRVKKLLRDARKQARAEVLMTSPRRERSLKEILFGNN